MTREERDAAEAAVRLGDQARVRRALDKIVGVEPAPAWRKTAGHVLVLRDAAGKVAFEFELADTNAVGRKVEMSKEEARARLEGVLLAFLDEVLS